MRLEDSADGDGFKSLLVDCESVLFDCESVLAECESVSEDSDVVIPRPTAMKSPIPREGELDAVVEYDMV